MNQWSCLIASSEHKFVADFFLVWRWRKVEATGQDVYSLSGFRPHLLPVLIEIGLEAIITPSHLAKSDFAMISDPF